MNIRNLLIFIILILNFSCSTDDTEKETDLEKLNLNGKVKSYLKTISRNSVSQNDSLKSEIKEVFRESIKFNKKGNIIEKNSYTKSGNLYKTWVSKYDKKNNEIGIIEIKYPNDTLKTWVKRYDNSGNQIELLIYDNKDSLLRHSKSIYNQFNQITELIILQSRKEKNQIIKAEYLYDNSGNRIKRTSIYKDGSKTEWLTKYDNKGNETEWMVYDKNGKLERRDIYFYDENSNLIKEKSFNSNNILESSGTFKFDNKGNEIEYVEYLYDSIISKEIYIYKEEKLVTKTYNSKGELKSTTELISKFDNNENLIKELLFTNGKLEKIKEYKIEYYK